MPVAAANEAEREQCRAIRRDGVVTIHAEPIPHELGELERTVVALLDLAHREGAANAITAVQGALTLKLARIVDGIDVPAGEMSVAQTHTCREFRLALGDLAGALERQRRR